MTPEPRSVEEALARLDDTVTLAFDPPSEAHDALALLRSELTRLRGIEEAAERLRARRPRLEWNDCTLPSLLVADLFRAALARPDRREEGE
jgi:hypothetical protein